jgi:uncharacterized membrane protein
VLPVALLCVLVGALLVAGVSAASGAFLAQRDLQSACDGAAVAAASGFDPNAVYAESVDSAELLPLANAAAADAVAEYQKIGFPDDATLSLSAVVDSDRVTVVCSRVVRVPFGGLFGVGGGLDRSTMSTARSPLKP